LEIFDMNTTVAAMADAGFRPAARMHANPRSDRIFFTSLAVLFLAITIVGFSQSYFFKQHFDTPPLSPLVHVHGATFTAWLVLLIAQTGFVAVRRRDLHKRAGIASVALVAVMTITGLMTAIAAAQRPGPGAFGIPKDEFLAVPLLSLLTFVTLFGLALRYRRQPDVHKRLIMIATIDILGAGVSRIFGMLGFGATVSIGACVLVIPVIAAYDYFSRGKVHPVTLWVGTFVVIFSPLRLAIGTTKGWLAFANWLIA
jgi:FtsH-binding integral membrane protein